MCIGSFPFQSTFIDKQKLIAWIETDNTYIIFNHYVFSEYENICEGDTIRMTKNSIMRVKPEEKLDKVKNNGNCIKMW